MPIIAPMYLSGYMPTYTNINTIENISAAVEKLAGKMRPRVIKTGPQSSISEALNVIGVSRVTDKYRATKIIKTIKAKVEV